MNQLTIIGNLTKDPELRTTQNGNEVCSFTVAVNRRGKDNGTDYFRVSVWGELGKNCQKFLTKGKKVCVSWSVSAQAYTNSKGEAVGSLEVFGKEVEFLTPKNTGFIPVDDPDNPFYEVRT